MRSKSYTELLTIPTFDERFEYLKTPGRIGNHTFGHERYLNQIFYATKEWKAFRRKIISRDNGCDLAIPDRDIVWRLMIHHIEPITMDDIRLRNPIIVDPDNVVCCSFETHNAIHFGDITNLPKLPVERRRGDTCPWKVY